MWRCGSKDLDLSEPRRIRGIGLGLRPASQGSDQMSLKGFSTRIPS